MKTGMIIKAGVIAVGLCMAAMANAGLLQALEEIGNGKGLDAAVSGLLSVDSGVKTPKANPKVGIDQYLPTPGRVVWYPQEPMTIPASVMDGPSGIEVAKEMKPAFDTLPAVPATGMSFNDIVRYMRSNGAVVYVPGEPGADELYARFEQGLANVNAKDVYGLSMLQLAQVSQDIMPIIRFLKAYQMAYDPGVVVVPPMSKTALTANSTCLDKDISAPNNGDSYKLQPITESVDPLLLPLHYAAIDVASDMAKDSQFQTLGINQRASWAVRNATRLVRPTKDEADAINYVYPQGAKILNAYIDAQAKAIAADPRGKRPAPKVVNLTKKDDFWAFNKVAPNQYVHASSKSGAYATNMTFVNNTSKPMVFESRKYSTLSQQKVQRVSLNADSQKPVVPTLVRGTAIKLADYLRERGYVFAFDYRDPGYRNGFNIEVNQALDASGPLGYLATAYTAVTGLDVVSGEPVGKMERTFSILSAAPIAKTVGWVAPATKNWSAFKKTTEAVQFGSDQALWVMNLIAWNKAAENYIATGNSDLPDLPEREFQEEILSEADMAIIENLGKIPRYLK